MKVPEALGVCYYSTDVRIWSNLLTECSKGNTKDEAVTVLCMVGFYTLIGNDTLLLSWYPGAEIFSLILSLRSLDTLVVVLCCVSLIRKMRLKHKGVLRHGKLIQ